MVEVTAAKVGGPSLDWLNPELGYLQSARSKAKVRSWFNAQAQAATVARGREAVEKLLQREGKTALKHAELATRLGFRSADALFEVVGKDELSLKSIEALLRPAPPPKSDADEIALQAVALAGGGGGVLVVGVGSLLTALARCCRPAPPDAIAGYVTRGKGVAVHRVGCSNLRELVARSAERVIDVAWGSADAGASGALSGRRQRRGERSQRPAARRLRGARQGEDQRHRRALAVGSRRRRRHRVHDLHGRGRRRVEARRCARARVPRSGRARRRGGAERGRVAQRTGIGVARSTGTAVTLFCGEPSMTRSE